MLLKEKGDREGGNRGHFGTGNAAHSLSKKQCDSGCRESGGREEVAGLTGERESQREPKRGRGRETREDHQLPSVRWPVDEIRFSSGGTSLWGQLRVQCVWRESQELGRAQLSDWD